MVPYGDVQPVGLQRVVLPPEHGPHVRGVLPRRVEVGVIPYRARHVMHGGRHGMEGGVAKREVGPQSIVGLDRCRLAAFAADVLVFVVTVFILAIAIAIAEKEAYQAIANGDPRPSFAAQEGVQVARREDGAGMKGHDDVDRVIVLIRAPLVVGKVVEQSCLGEEVQVYRVAADGRAATGRGRVEGVHDDRRWRGCGRVVVVVVGCGRRLLLRQGGWGWWGGHNNRKRK